MRQGHPLAQTFTLQSDDEANEGGRFLTSVDIFFANKHAKLPVLVEIRNTINGIPGTKVLPYSRQALLPANINTDLTAATATTFTFDSPVYVMEGVEYALVVKTNTPDYKIWLTVLGDAEIGGSRNISTQPHAGVLYKSSNDTSWAISPQEDLKFTIKAAKFTTGSAGVVTLQNDTLLLKQLPRNPLIFKDASTVLKIQHRFPHGMYATTNNITINGAKSTASTTLNGAITASATTLTLASGTNFDDTTGKYAQVVSGSKWFIKIDDEILSYTTISTNAVSGITRAVDGTTAAAHADGATVELYQLHKVPFTEINKTHTAIANIGMDSHTISLSTTPVVDGAGGTAENGGDVVTITENQIIDVGKTLLGTMEFPDARLSAKLQATTATSPSGTQTSFTKTSLADADTFDLNENYKSDIPIMVCSEINESNELGGSKSLEIPITLTSSNPNLSPVIDLTRSSWLSVQNMLDDIDTSSDVYPTTDFKASTEPEGDNNAAIYLTKKVTLENPATALKIFFAAHRPSTSEIKVLHKILRTDDASDFDDLGYTFFNTTGVPDQTVNPSLDKDDFQEYLYTAGVTDDGLGTPLDEFISFQIKIVMQGTNCAEPPRIKDLRAIALVT